MGTVGIMEEGAKIGLGPYTTMGRAGKVRVSEWPLKDQEKVTNQHSGGTSQSLPENPAASLEPQRSAGGRVSDGWCPVSGCGPGAAVGQAGWQLEGRTNRGGGICKEKLGSAGRISASISQHNNLQIIKAAVSLPPCKSQAYFSFG